MADDPKTYENIPIPELGNLTLVQLREKKEALKALLKAIRDLFPFKLHRYTSAERQLYAKQAAFREGEKDAFDALMDGVDHNPAYVKSLAKRDSGVDDSRVETEVLRARAAAYLELHPVAEDLEDLAIQISDTATQCGVLAKALVSPIYGALRVLAETDEELRAIIALAIDYNHGRAPKKPKS